ncbi:hypothetical protein G6F63_015399 [Rhizopus arrhizus]|nr:hypothetical protein G6F63_015399 [Rhizopus arrhizus]
MAERFDATIEGPDQQAVLEQGARLDDTCAALDTQVGLTLMLGAAQPAAEVLSVARDPGFVADGNRLAWPAENGVTRFTLSRADGAAFDAGMGAAPSAAGWMGAATWRRAGAPNWSTTRANRWPTVRKR